MTFLDIRGRRIEVECLPGLDAAGSDKDAPPVVFLHEALGSIGLWRDFPALVSRATGAPAIVYSRYGLGRSEPLREPRTRDYLHAEALETLPDLLRRLEVREPILFGHSDGASIALIHAGAGREPVAGLILEAPHVFIEDITLAGIRAAGEAYADTDLRSRLARHHLDVDRTFRWGWHDIWLDPAFADWNIEDCLSGITCPVLLIQGEEDAYGTAAQLEAIAAGVSGPCETLMVRACGHTPHREARDAVLAATTDFIGRIADRRRAGATAPVKPPDDA